jgi:hypothetical protein
MFCHWGMRFADIVPARRLNDRGPVRSVEPQRLAYSPPHGVWRRQVNVQLHQEPASVGASSRSIRPPLPVAHWQAGVWNRRSSLPSSHTRDFAMQHHDHARPQFAAFDPSHCAASSFHVQAAAFWDSGTPVSERRVPGNPPAPGPGPVHQDRLPWRCASLALQSRQNTGNIGVRVCRTHQTR